VLDRLRARRNFVIAVAVAYIVFLVVGVVSDNGQTLFYGLLIPGLVAVVASLDARRPFSDLVLWGLVLWAVLHLAGGLVPAADDRVLYNVWLLPFVRFDQLVHAVGFGFAGLAFRESVRPALDDAASGAAMVFIGGVGIGGLNEMIEFLITKFVDDTNIGGFDNTGWDLVANFVGASIAATWIRRRSAGRSETTSG
jgi:hypothetical protein